MISRAMSVAVTLDNTRRQSKRQNCTGSIFRKEEVQLNSRSTKEWAKKGEQSQVENCKKSASKNLSLKFPKLFSLLH